MNGDSTIRVLEAREILDSRGAPRRSSCATVTAVGTVIAPALRGVEARDQDLMERAVAAFRLRGPWDTRRAARALRDRGRCLWCSLGYTRHSPGVAEENLLRAGRDPHALRELAGRTRAYWSRAVCGRCVELAASARCRRHFREEVSAGLIADVGPHRALVEDVLDHLAVYSRSFVWEHHGIESDEDRAALITAAGWCGGWRGLLVVLD